MTHPDPAGFWPLADRVNNFAPDTKARTEWLQEPPRLAVESSTRQSGAIPWVPSCGFCGEEVGAEGLEPAEPKGMGLPSTASGFERGHTSTPTSQPSTLGFYSAIYNRRVHNTTWVTEMISVAPGDPEMFFGLNNKPL